MNAANIQPYSRAVVKLLKGIVEKDDVVWNEVLDYQSEILDYISVMGLELIVKKDEGFAFVKQMKLDDDKTLNMVSRRLYGFGDTHRVEADTRRLRPQSNKVSGFGQVCNCY